MLYPIQNDRRNVLDLSDLWDFQPDPDETGEQAGWPQGLPHPRPMAVPGSWNEQYTDLYNYFGLSWYVRRAWAPSNWQGQRIFIRLGSACYLGTVYVNGIKLGSHAGGHLPFAFDLTEHIRWNEANFFAISVENHLLPERVPAGGAGPLGVSGYPATPYDFFPFAGLHRPVVLYSVPPTHLTDITVATELDGTTAVVKVSAALNGRQGAEAETGRIRLTGAGQAIEAVLRFTEGAAETALTVPGARLWSGDDPLLYDLEISTRSDRYALPVGLRTVAVAGHQILLNGQPVALNGFGRHEDFIASGRGLNLPLLVKDYDLMRWVGANSYRTSHYPYSEEEMQLADREGFLIIDEIPAVSLQFHDAALNAEHLRMCRQQLEELVARDKNHPSVIMWSVANEPLPASLPALVPGGQPNPEAEAAGKQFLDALVGHARALDPTRLVTVVGVMGGPPEWLAESDVICINRYWGWYVLGGQLDQALAALETELDELWARFGRPVIVTEFGADTVAGLHGNPPLMWTEEYQAELIGGYLEVAAKKDFVAGMQVWNFADFAAVQGTGRVGGQNLKGVFTRTRAPKLAAQVLREHWAGLPAA